MDLQSSTTMPITLRLNCLIDGEDIAFTINATGDDSNVYDLKKSIQKRRALDTLQDADPHDLKLWKLKDSNPIAAEPDDSLVKRIEVLGHDFLKFADKLGPTETLFNIFPTQPLRDHIHIIVTCPRTQSSPRKRLRITSPLPDPPPNVVERRDTVSAIYRKLLSYRFIQVRGTSASGKSTLAMLLGRHIRVQEPDVRVIWIGGWNIDDVAQCGGWSSYLAKRKGWIPGEDTVFIFDSAQASYKDGELWNNLFKGIHDYRDRRAIAFATYGSPSSFFDIEGTTFYVASAARVSLLPTAHEDNLPAAGLLFTRTEFDELVSKQYPDSECHFHSSFLDAVYKFTEGHVGAIYSFLHIILGSDLYRELKHSGQRYTLELFQKRVSLVWFLHQFENTAAGVFRRGLPDNDLRVPAVACVFSSVLRMGSVQDTDFTTEDNSSALQLCFRKGWLHTDYIDNKTKYFFSSSLHRWYIEWKLWGILDTTFCADDILDFVIDVISIFSPRMLSTTRRVSAAGQVQRPPEAQYQDEFYRCCHTRSNGSLVTFPEFGTAKGRVDFYIPAKKWGVELLRDGDQLAQHSGPFSSQTGCYGTTLSLTDYTILDCRTTQPTIQHPHLQKLYHIVFNDGFNQVKILDNELKVVPRGEFILS